MQSENLFTLGGVEFKKQTHPLTSQDLKTLEEEIFSKTGTFEIILKGDTDETSSLNCYRLKKPNDDAFSSKTVQHILEQEKFTNFLRQETKLENFIIDRCQAHIYRKGDFLGLHDDTESCPDYRFSCILSFSDDYEGGTFNVHNHGHIMAFKPQKGSLLMIQSGLNHEVEPLQSGERCVLVFFLKSTS